MSVVTGAATPSAPPSRIPRAGPRWLRHQGGQAHRGPRRPRGWSDRGETAGLVVMESGGSVHRE
ncbi:hypothetical protein QJS66_14450 [Kocuria rhizophila]|nr:hypothetical protein QJS66_14450 [Kocuria rhizophila]